MWSVPVAAVLVGAYVARIAAFNVQPQGAVVFSPGAAATPLDHFGYGVALTRAQRRLWVVVAAPGAASLRDSRFTRPGALYQCWNPLETNNPTCRQINLEQGNNREQGSEDFLHVSNGTLGSSLDAVSESEGMVVCNSGFKDLKYNRLDMPGKCYWLEDIQSNTPEKLRISLRKEEVGMSKIVVDGKTYTDDLKTQMMGFSVHQEKEQTLLVGSPGYFWGRGAVAKIYLTSDSELWGVAIPLLRNDSYFGYSVTSGKFLPSNETVYASGAPRGDVDDLQGKVVIFNFENVVRKIHPVNILKILNGSQIGEYFGASLCAVDLNNDDIDDLLVGAPLHKSVISDEGKVYVFISNEKTGIMTPYSSEVEGNKFLGARFGTAISPLGDINKDEYQDVAIGAPYEDGGRGAVYIYYGGPKDQYLKRQQRFAAAQATTNLRGFGFSISRGADVDDNSYNDVAVGSYLSNHAVLLRTSPVLYMKSFVKVVGGKIFMKAENASISICLEPKELLRDVGVEVTVNIDPIYNRASIASGLKIFSYTQNMTKDKITSYCKDYQIFIKSATRSYRPLDVELTFKIAYPVQVPGRSFCQTCPMLDPEKLKSSHRIYFETGCEGQVCKTNFLTKAEFVGIRSPFFIGNVSIIDMHLEVKNLLENSFETNVSINFSSNFKLRQVHKYCRKVKTAVENTISLLCDVPYIMNKDSKSFEVDLSFDMDHVPWDVSQMLVNISVEGDGEEITPLDNNVTLKLELQHAAKVYIKGRSVPETTDIYIKQDGTDEFVYQDRTFEHIYTVINEGPSPIHDMIVQFSFPSIVKTGSSEITYFQINPKGSHVLKLDSLNDENRRDLPQEKYEESSYLILDCSYPNIECKSFAYSKTLYKNTGITFAFAITGLFKEQGQYLNKGGVLIKSTGLIMNEYLLDQDHDNSNHPLSTSIQTLLHGNIPSGEVASWIIVVAIICGILILIGLIVILWKFGFFKRKKPPTPDEPEANKKPATDDKIDTDPLCEENP